MSGKRRRIIWRFGRGLGSKRYTLKNQKRILSQENVAFIILRRVKTPPSIYTKYTLIRKKLMRINADFSKIASVKPEDYQWVTSPGGEVERVMLDRIGEENARATSLVKYSPQTIFPEHQHPSGEEILVLSGVFIENSNTHYPAGWYMRNPHNSRHTPSSEEGALIFVKLRQMSQTETMPVRINTHDLGNWNEFDGRYICPLFHAENEHTYLEKLKAQQSLIYDPAQGIETLVINGELNLTQENQVQEQYAVGSWIRIPPDAHVSFQASASGAMLYIKTDHLIAATASALKMSQS